MKYEPESEASNAPTGEAIDQIEHKIIKFPFGKYELTLKLSANNEFLDVLEIRINKDFAASIKEKQRKGFHDVDEFYPEE